MESFFYLRIGQGFPSLFFDHLPLSHLGSCYPHTLPKSTLDQVNLFLQNGVWDYEEL